MSTREIAELASQVTELQNSVMQDNVDLNTRLLEVTAAVATLTSQLNANASAVEDNDKRVKEVIVTVAGKLGQSDAVFDNLQNSVRMQRETMEDLEDKLKRLPGTPAHPAPNSSYKRSVLDFKALSDCKTLDHGGGFLTWADSFRNVMDNFNPAAREIMVFTESLKLDEVEIMKKEENIDSFNAIGRLYEEKRPSGTRGFSEFNDLNRDLWAALIHRTSGEARKKINNCGQGQGLFAYLKIWRWYTSQTTTMQAESRSKTMHPDQIKKIEMVADAVEDWERRLSLIEENDEASGEDKAKSKTPDQYKMTALWCLLPDSLRDEVDLRSDERGGERHKMRSFIMKFAEAKRKRPNDNAMDTSALAREAERGIPRDDDSENYYDDGAWWWGEPDYYGADVNAMGYGKGKGKGKSYGGYNSGSGKSYGKGGDKGKGYSKGGYKGGDKGKGKGKGKDSGGGSVNIKRNAAGVAIFVGDCHNC